MKFSPYTVMYNEKVHFDHNNFWHNQYITIYVQNNEQCLNVLSWMLNAWENNVVESIP
jgi:hypothetical protein